MTPDELRKNIAECEASMCAYTEWRAKLEKWRKPLCDELLALPPRIRGAHTFGVKRNLELSILTIDRGLGVLTDTGYDLTNLRLGELMRADGYEPVGADPSRCYSGQMPWMGSLRDIDKWLKDLAKAKAHFVLALAQATQTDAERANREAESAAYRAAMDSMRVTGSDDGTYLVARAPDGRVLDRSELTKAQAAALDRANAQHARPSEEVTS